MNKKPVAKKKEEHFANCYLCNDFVPKDTLLQCMGTGICMKCKEKLTDTVIIKYMTKEIKKDGPIDILNLVAKKEKAPNVVSVHECPECLCDYIESGMVSTANGRVCKDCINIYNKCDKCEKLDTDMQMIDSKPMCRMCVKEILEQKPFEDPHDQYNRWREYMIGKINVTRDLLLKEQNKDDDVLNINWLEVIKLTTKREVLKDCLNESDYVYNKEERDTIDLARAALRMMVKQEAKLDPLPELYAVLNNGTECTCIKEKEQLHNTSGTMFFSLYTPNRQGKVTTWDADIDYETYDKAIADLKERKIEYTDKVLPELKGEK
jgi:hypothetical protein